MTRDTLVPFAGSALTRRDRLTDTLFPNAEQSAAPPAVRESKLGEERGRTDASLNGGQTAVRCVSRSPEPVVITAAEIADAAKYETFVNDLLHQIALTCDITFDELVAGMQYR
jgi:hypothetical protein